MKQYKLVAVTDADNGVHQVPACSCHTRLDTRIVNNPHNREHDGGKGREQQEHRRQDHPPEDGGSTKYR